ncbi:MAG: helix-turn-helix domain-containing protein [Thermoplasmata archaeon]
MREGVGKALRRVFGQEDLIRKLEPRKAGVSHLMNPKRRKIFAYLLRFPCSHLRQLSRVLRIPIQTLKWHLVELEKAGILSPALVGNKKCYFIPARIEREDIAALSLLSDGMNRKIVYLLMKRGPFSQKEIFTSLRTYRQAVQPRLKILEEAGMIHSSRRGRERTYKIADNLTEMRGRYLERKAEVSKRLREILDDDGLSPKVSKTLSRSTIYTIDTGEGREEIEAFFDPLVILKE